MSEELENLPNNRLTPKQARFVLEYLVDLNATQAAIRAGYSENTAGVIGSENLKKPYIFNAIQEEMEARAIRTLITADRVLSDMFKVAQRCMDAEPVMIFNRVNQKWEQLGEEHGEPVYQFDSQGANRALENLARNQKLLTDKLDLGNPDGSNMKFPDLINVFVDSPEALKEVLQTPPPETESQSTPTESQDQQSAQ